MLIPFFSACAGSFDYYLFAFRSGCPPKVHWVFFCILFSSWSKFNFSQITQFLASYFWIVPVVCMVLNIILIFHMSLKSKKNNQMSQNSRSTYLVLKIKVIIYRCKCSASTRKKAFDSINCTDHVYTEPRNCVFYYWVVHSKIVRNYKNRSFSSFWKIN